MNKLIAALAIASVTSLGFAQTTTPAKPSTTATKAPAKMHAPKKAPVKQVKAVYHITTGIDTAAAALNNVSNHLNADPTAKIVVVTNGPGIDFMIQDAKDSKGREFSGLVSDLAAKGVEFRVCNNTLKVRNIAPESLLMEAKVVPSGVSEAARLQALEGFVYIKP